MYSPRVKELITTLPNRGRLDQATHQARAENPVCGDITDLYIRVVEGRVTECTFQTYGCPGAIAASAALTLLCKGRTVEECRALSREQLLEYLQGLPSHKSHALDLALDVLRAALNSAAKPLS